MIRLASGEPPRLRVAMVERDRGTMSQRERTLGTTEVDLGEKSKGRLWEVRLHGSGGLPKCAPRTLLVPAPRRSPSLGSVSHPVASGARSFTMSFAYEIVRAKEEHEPAVPPLREPAARPRKRCGAQLWPCCLPGTRLCYPVRSLSCRCALLKFFAAFSKAALKLSTTRQCFCSTISTRLCYSALSFGFDMLPFTHRLRPRCCQV